MVQNFNLINFRDILLCLCPTGAFLLYDAVSLIDYRKKTGILRTIRSIRCEDKELHGRYGESAMHAHHGEDVSHAFPFLSQVFCVRSLQGKYLGWRFYSDQSFLLGIFLLNLYKLVDLPPGGWVHITGSFHAAEMKSQWWFQQIVSVCRWTESKPATKPHMTRRREKIWDLHNWAHSPRSGSPPGLLSERHSRPTAIIYFGSPQSLSRSDLFMKIEFEVTFGDFQSVRKLD